MFCFNFICIIGNWKVSTYGNVFNKSIMNSVLYVSFIFNVTNAKPHENNVRHRNVLLKTHHSQRPSFNKWKDTTYKYKYLRPVVWSVWGPEVASCVPLAALLQFKLSAISWCQEQKSDSKSQDKLTKPTKCITLVVSGTENTSYTAYINAILQDICNI